MHQKHQALIAFLQIKDALEKKERSHSFQSFQQPAVETALRDLEVPAEEGETVLTTAEWMQKKELTTE
ncbi:MAG: hypothetical protein K0S07_1272 [Chlamydiales bacterium]|jgi:hypothetical protein|nr:hypothetical protein [Chlamydiales bacterium]